MFLSLSYLDINIISTMFSSCVFSLFLSPPIPISVLYPSLSTHPPAHAPARSEVLPCADFPHAVSQAALGIVCRAGDERALRMVECMVCWGMGGCLAANVSALNGGMVAFAS
jgi:hypothetical protein